MKKMVRFGTIGAAVIVVLAGISICVCAQTSVIVKEKKINKSLDIQFNGKNIDLYNLINIFFKKNVNMNNIFGLLEDIIMYIFFVLFGWLFP